MRLSSELCLALASWISLVMIFNTRADATDQVFTGLGSGDPKLVLSDIAEAQRLRELQIRNLVSLLRSSDLLTQVSAAYMLGYLRIEVASKDLVEHLTLDSRVLPEKARWPWGDYPAADALVEIGSSSVKPLIDYLAISKEAFARRLAIRTLKQLKTSCELLPLLQKAKASSVDVNAKTNYDESIKLLSDEERGDSASR